MTVQKHEMKNVIDQQIMVRVNNTVCTQPLVMMADQSLFWYQNQIC